MDLLPGAYALSVSRAGFKRSDSNVVVKRATDGQTITVSLEVGENRNIGQIYVTADPEILLSAGNHDSIKLSATQLKVLPHIPSSSTTLTATPTKAIPASASPICLRNWARPSASNFAALR